MAGNGTKYGGSRIDAGVMLKAGTEETSIYLPRVLYDAATNAVNRFEVRVKVTYSGMLGERSDQYETVLSFWWRSNDKDFGYSTKEFR